MELAIVLDGFLLDEITKEMKLHAVEVAEESKPKKGLLSNLNFLAGKTQSIEAPMVFKEIYSEDIIEEFDSYLDSCRNNTPGISPIVNKPRITLEFIKMAQESYTIDFMIKADTPSKEDVSNFLTSIGLGTIKVLEYEMPDDGNEDYVISGNEIMKTMHYFEQDTDRVFFVADESINIWECVGMYLKEYHNVNVMLNRFYTHVNKYRSYFS